MDKFEMYLLDKIQEKRQAIEEHEDPSIKLEMANMVEEFITILVDYDLTYRV